MAKTQKVKAAPEATGGEFEPLRERLLNQRNEMAKLYHLDLQAGQDAADDGTDDIVDRANNAYNRELNFSLSDSERGLLLQIEDALRRLEDGHFGRCASCGNPIARPRLEAVPWARYCIDCQELAEKGLLGDSD
ncbi:MAG TPA: TraR/DksA family transcriptional regulator [Thermoanaerobaculia bacterium]|nr:TraR/DksA family transcriptional regulator [Thermoanaerobaculia bacterium]